eukprot:464501-Rhodomonas_salina.5
MGRPILHSSMPYAFAVRHVVQTWLMPYALAVHCPVLTSAMLLPGARLDTTPSYRPISAFAAGKLPTYRRA